VSVSQSEQAFRSGSAPKVGRPGDGGPTLSASPPTSTVNGRASGGAGSRPSVHYADTSRPMGPATGNMAAVGPRKVRLTVARVDPWSVLKLSFLLSVALGIVLVTASVVLWSVLDAMGVFTSINNELRSIGSAQSKFDINEFVGLGRVVSLSTVIAVVNVLIIMALSTLGALLYNLASSLVGGLQVTLSDD
jgi:hypothetical protein